MQTQASEHELHCPRPLCRLIEEQSFEILVPLPQGWGSPWSSCWGSGQSDRISSKHAGIRDAWGSDCGEKEEVETQACNSELPLGRHFPCRWAWMNSLRRKQARVNFLLWGRGYPTGRGKRTEGAEPRTQGAKSVTKRDGPSDNQQLRKGWTWQLGICCHLQEDTHAAVWGEVKPQRLRSQSYPLASVEKEQGSVKQ